MKYILGITIIGLLLIAEPFSAAAITAAMLLYFTA